MSFNWPVQIGRLVLIKQEIADLDAIQAYPWHLPRVAATEAAITKMEKIIKAHVLGEHRAFLRHADGWPGFQVDIDLLGTADYVENSASYSRGLELISYLEQGVLDVSNCERSDLIPIGTSRHQIDVLVAVRNRPLYIWFAGSEIERYDDFSELYLDMLNHNQAALDELKQQQN